MRIGQVALALIGCVAISLISARPARGDDYRLGADDVIDISVANHVDMNRTVTVLPDGKISFPGIGQLQAAGRTAESVAADIRAVLEKTLNNVDVSVAVKEVHSRHASIVGALKTPGVYDLKQGSRLLDLVAAAGGLTVKPVRVTARMVRAGVVSPLDMARAISAPESDADPTLAPDDLVILDEIDVHNQVHVMGQVKTPGAYDLDENLTIVSLIAESGSFTDGAALKRVYVLRGGNEIHFDLYGLAAKGTPDSSAAAFKLQAGDVLFVPEIETKFGVMGEVNKPGYYDMPEDRSEATVLKALGRAGGQLQDGDLRRAALLRVVNGKATVTHLNIDKMLRSGDIASNVALQNDDVLFIPAKSTKGLSWVDLLSPITALYYLRGHP